MNGHDDPSLFEPQTDEEWSEWWGENRCTCGESGRCEYCVERAVNRADNLLDRLEEGQYWNAGEIAAMEMGD